MADRSIRASDGDREHVVGILRDQTGQGRLTLDEFEERMSAAYTAKTWDDLRPLTRDLPVDVAFEASGDTRASEPAHWGQPRDDRRKLRHDRRQQRRQALGTAGPGTLIAPALLGLLVFLVIAEGFSPFIFFGLFWLVCARGCRPRRFSGHQEGH